MEKKINYCGFKVGLVVYGVVYGYKIEHLSSWSSLVPLMVVINCLVLNCIEYWTVHLCILYLLLILVELIYIISRDTKAYQIFRLPHFFQHLS